MASESYGELVARIRDEKGWKQKDLAARAKVPLRTLQSIESGETQKPQRATRIALNEALGIEGDVQQERESWPADVQIFLDMMGAWLTSMPEGQRLSRMRDLTVQIVGGR